MKILITGGTGLIGKRLSQQLSARGHQLYIVSRSEHQSEDPNVQFVQWDGKSLDYEKIGPVDAICNLAGAGIADQKWSADYKKVIVQSRLDAAAAVKAYIDQCEPKPKVLVQASGVGYYGTDEKKVFAEADKPGKDFLARTCVQWEEAVAEVPIRTVILRTGIVLAPEGGAFPKLLAPFKFYAGGYLGNGRQPFPWIHIDDMVGVYEFVIKNEAASGPLNIAAAQQMTNRAFARVLGKAMGKPSGLPVPKFAVKAMLGEQALIVLEGQYVDTEKLQALGYTFQYPKPEEAVKHILKAN